MVKLNLNRCDLTGTLPVANLATLSSLTFLNLENNRFEGPPLEAALAGLSPLTKLEKLGLGGSKLGKEYLGN